MYKCMYVYVYVPSLLKRSSEKTKWVGTLAEAYTCICICRTPLIEKRVAKSTLAPIYNSCNFTPQTQEVVPDARSV